MNPSNHQSPPTSSSKDDSIDVGMNYSENIPPYYKYMGVDPSISMQDLSRCYKKLSLELHPDRATYRANSLKEEDTKRFQLITEAYKVLSDPQSRTAYDTRHGLNFHARVSKLQETISSHNSEVTQLQTERGARRRGRSPETVSGNPGTGIRIKSISEHSKDTDESEEEYCPAESTEPDALPSVDPASVLSAQLSWTVGPGKTATATFHCYPFDLTHTESPLSTGSSGIRPLAATFADDEGALPQDGDHYETLTIYRPAGARSWGLQVSGDVLVGCPSHPGVPFPARIVQLNGRSLPPHASWDTLRERLDGPAEGEGGLSVNTGVTANESGVPAEGETRPGHSTLLASDALPAAAGDGSSVTAKGRDLQGLQGLQLTLHYGVRMWRLVGDWAVLRDPAAMDALVPPGQVVAALPSLGLDAAVLAVNGTTVRDADGMRRLLGRLTEVDTSSEPPSAFPLGPSTVILQCATLKGPVRGQ